MSEQLVRALDETWSAIHSLLAKVGDDDWHRPTPCTEWDVRDLAAHLGAVEGFFQGLPQPEAPPPSGNGIDDWTATGIRAREAWTIEEVLAEVEAASAAQLERLRGFGDSDWEQATLGPLGETTQRGLAEIRIFDLYVHLLDLRMALGRPLDPSAEPTACAVCVGRAVDMTGWGAVKKAGLSDGARVRLALSEPGARTADVVVENGRGAVTEATGEPEAADVISGPGAAYLLVAAGRVEMADAAGGLVASGPAASQLLDCYRIFQ